MNRVRRVLGLALLVFATVDARPQETTPKRVSTQPAIEYPQAAKLLEIEGDARFLVHVSAEGTVDQVKIVTVPGDAPAFKWAIERAVKEWTFESATRDGAAVEGVYQSRVRFQLPDLPGVRSYRLSPADTWQGAMKVVEQLGFKKRTRRVDDGIFVSKSRRVEASPLDLADIPSENPIGRFRLYINIPTHRRQARVYVSVMYTAKKSGNSEHFAQSRSLANAFFQRLDKELGQAGSPVPGSARRRAEFDASTDNGPCREQLAIDLGDLGLAPPIPLYRDEPVFSRRVEKIRPTGFAAFDVQVFADGVVQDVRRVATPQSQSDPEVDRAIEAAVRTWRFPPALRNGCPMNFIYSLIHDYPGGR